MYRIKRQTVHLWGEPHCVCWDRLEQQHQQQRRRVIRKQKPVGQVLWLGRRCCNQSLRENSGFSFAVSWPDGTVVSLTSDCACCFRITGRLMNRRRLREFTPQSFFCTLSWFFWIFWWTTFTVVRKFPRNRTRNVSASINTWEGNKQTGVLL